ncbi:MAG: ABC transporter permease [Mycobacteriaceae bacterium]
MTDQEKVSIEQSVSGLSQGQIVRQRFLHHRGAMSGLACLCLILLLVSTSIGWGFIPGWWSQRPSEVAEVVNGGHPTMSVVPQFLGGNGISFGIHPFGQDEVGRDYFAQTMRGAQQTLVVVSIVGMVAGLLGIAVGALSGFFRGWIDAILMRLTDVFITIPLVVVAAVVGLRVGNSGVWVLAVFIGLVSWTGLARLVRGDFLALREREFVDAARVAGASSFRIMFRHILPNAVGVIVVNTTLLMSTAILLETSISYLGFGVKAPDVSLGSLISMNQTAFSTRPWLFWWPGIFIVTIALAINFIGDGLRDAFDPRQKQKVKSKVFGIKKVRTVENVTKNDS